MGLISVTLTGADDQTDIDRLKSLSAKYPFVEWAILFSQSKSGVFRYPTLEWVSKLSDANLRLSAHLCGKWVDDIINGDFTFLQLPVSKIFSRFQLNLSKNRLFNILKNPNPKIKETLKVAERQIIFGGNYQDIDFHPQHLSDLGVVPLYDASGGTGSLPKTWDMAMINPTGYAGGLGPDNLIQELGNIVENVVHKDFWIDMESKIRTDDVFDLDKCEFVLETINSNFDVPVDLMEIHKEADFFYLFYDNGVQLHACYDGVVSSLVFDLVGKNKNIVRYLCQMKAKELGLGCDLYERQ